MKGAPQTIFDNSGEVGDRGSVKVTARSKSAPAQHRQRRARLLFEEQDTTGSRRSIGHISQR